MENKNLVLELEVGGNKESTLGMIDPVRKNLLRHLGLDIPIGSVVSFNTWHRNQVVRVWGILDGWDYDLDEPIIRQNPDIDSPYKLGLATVAPASVTFYDYRGNTLYEPPSFTVVDFGD